MRSQQIDSLGSHHAVRASAIGHDLSRAGHLREPRRQLIDRDRHGARDVCRQELGAGPQVEHGDLAGANARPEGLARDQLGLVGSTQIGCRRGLDLGHVAACGDELAGRFRAAGLADVQTETLLVHYEFGSLDEYMRFLQEVAVPIKNLLVDESPERRAQVWAAVAGTNEQFVGADGKLQASGESIVVAGRR